jgi:hypothetical protein
MTVYRYEWNGINLQDVKRLMRPAADPSISAGPAPQPLIDITIAAPSGSDAADLENAMAVQGWTFVEADPVTPL